MMLDESYVKCAAVLYRASNDSCSTFLTTSVM